MLDPYNTLKVDRDASQDEIKRAYRKLAKEHHPDLNPNNPASARRFKDISVAYDTLSDETKRRQYDREVKAAAAAAAGRRAEAASNTAFDDGLDSFFGGRSWSHRGDQAATGAPRRRGADIYQSLKIGFVEAALGTRKRLAINEQRSLDVAVPPLTQDGQTLRLKGQGGAGQNGGPAGDVFVEITVEAHPFFVRKDYDIHMSLSVTVTEAVLGATITVPTLHGMVQLKVPKGANTDTMLRMKGQGVPLPGGTGRGDHYVTLKVILPDQRDPEFAQLVEQWSKRHSYAVRAPMKLP